MSMSMSFSYDVPSSDETSRRPATSPMPASHAPVTQAPANKPSTVPPSSPNQGTSISSNPSNVGSVSPFISFAPTSGKNSNARPTNMPSTQIHSTGPTKSSLPSHSATSSSVPSDRPSSTLVPTVTAAPSATPKPSLVSSALAANSGPPTADGVFQCTGNLVTFAEPGNNTTTVFLTVGYLAESVNITTDSFVPELEIALLETAISAALGCNNSFIHRRLKSRRKLSAVTNTVVVGKCTQHFSCSPNNCNEVSHFLS